MHHKICNKKSESTQYASQGPEFPKLNLDLIYTLNSPPQIVCTIKSSVSQANLPNRITSHGILAQHDSNHKQKYHIIFPKFITYSISRYSQYQQCHVIKQIPTYNDYKFITTRKWKSYSIYLKITHQSLGSFYTPFNHKVNFT